MELCSCIIPAETFPSPLSHPHFPLCFFPLPFPSLCMYICKSPQQKKLSHLPLCRWLTVWICKYAKIEASALLTHSSYTWSTSRYKRWVCFSTTEVAQVLVCTLLIFRMSKTTVNAIISSIQYIIHMTQRSKTMRNKKVKQTTSTAPTFKYNFIQIWGLVAFIYIYIYIRIFMFLTVAFCYYSLPSGPVLCCSL